MPAFDYAADVAPLEGQGEVVLGDGRNAPRILLAGHRIHRPSGDDGAVQRPGEVNKRGGVLQDAAEGDVGGGGGGEGGGRRGGEEGSGSAGTCMHDGMTV